MTASVKTAIRHRVVLKLPEYRVPRLVTMARAVVKAMTNNKWFPSPVPPLAKVRKGIDKLDVAQTATLSRTAGTIAVRDEMRAALVTLLDQLRFYVQAVADRHPEEAVSIIESAGMSVKKRRVFPEIVFAATNGRVSGSVDLVAPRAASRAAYEWQCSIDGMKTWISLPTTNSATTTAPGLEPGTRVYFRYRAVVKNRVSNWSDPISIIVV